MSNERDAERSPLESRALEGGRAHVERPREVDAAASDPTLASLLARRGFVLASLGFLAACATSKPGGAARALAAGGTPRDEAMPNGLWTSGDELPPPRYARPVTPMPRTPAANATASAASRSSTTSSSSAASAASSARASGGASCPVPKPTPAASPWNLTIPPTYAGKVIPRSAWTSWTPDPREMTALGRVARITVHHEGNGAFHAAGAAETKARLVNVLQGETAGRHLDIAYHYVIDRAGRVWEARDVRYRGSHTRGNHAGNLGIMCLGNFEEQEISRAQVAALERFLGEQMKKHRLTRRQVFTHQELSPTLCPGRDLQRRMGAMRSRLA